MDIADFNFRRIDSYQDLKPFDCGDEDLNDFFLNDSALYAKQLLSVTYVFESEAETIGFFTVLNDRISKADSDKFSNLLRRIPNDKRHPFLPAVKVGRLGVTDKYKRNRIGSQLLDFIKTFFTVRNKTGCRYITVDAYNRESVLNFYYSNGFKFLIEADKSEDTRSMYFDLMNFIRG